VPSVRKGALSTAREQPGGNRRVLAPPYLMVRFIRAFFMRFVVQLHSQPLLDARAAISTPSRRRTSVPVFDSLRAFFVSFVCFAVQLLYQPLGACTR